MDHFVDKVIPGVCKKEKEYEDVAWAVSMAGPLVSDLVLSGCDILNVVIPAATAAVMEYDTPENVAAEAEKAAYITAGIPGPKAAATKVAKLSCAVAEVQ